MRIYLPIKKFTVCFYTRNEDDIPTDFGKSGFEGDLETRAPGGGSGGNLNEEDDQTRIKKNFDNDQVDSGDTFTQFDIPETGTLGLLWVLNGNRRGKIYQVRDGDTIGKKDGNLYLDDPKVSTPHCRFRIEKSNFVLWDCGSKNGTSVNNKRIRCATELHENDIIKIGDTQFIFKTIS